MTAVDEWKEGYRDGLGAALTVVKTVADDNGTAGDAAELLEVLTSSHVLDTASTEDTPNGDPQ